MYVDYLKGGEELCIVYDIIQQLVTQNLQPVPHLVYEYYSPDRKGAAMGHVADTYEGAGLAKALGEPGAHVGPVGGGWGLTGSASGAAPCGWLLGLVCMACLLQLR